MAKSPQASWQTRIRVLVVSGFAPFWIWETNDFTLKEWIRLQRLEANLPNSTKKKKEEEDFSRFQSRYHVPIPYIFPRGSSTWLTWRMKACICWLLVCCLLWLLWYWHRLQSVEKWSSTQPVRLRLRVKKIKIRRPSTSSHQFSPEALDKVFSSAELNFLTLTALDRFYFSGAGPAVPLRCRQYSERRGEGRRRGAPEALRGVGFSSFFFSWSHTRRHLLVPPQDALLCPSGSEKSLPTAGTLHQGTVILSALFHCNCLSSRVIIRTCQCLDLETKPTTRFFLREKTETVVLVTLLLIASIASHSNIN